MQFPTPEKHTSQRKTRATCHGLQYDRGKEGKNRDLPSWTLSWLNHGERPASWAQLTGGGLLAGLRPFAVRCSAVAHSSVPGESHRGVVVVGLGLGVRAQGYGLAQVPGAPVITTIDVVKTETGDLFPRSKGSSVQPCKVSNSPGAHPYYGTMTAPTPCSSTSLTPGRPVGTGFISMSLPDDSLAR